MTAQAPKEVPIRAGGDAQKKGAELPDFIIARNKLFEDLKKQYDEKLLAMDHPEIKVTIDYGYDDEGKHRGSHSTTAKAFETRPGVFLREAPKEVSADVVLCKVNGELWDMDRPLETDSTITYVPFSSKEGRFVFWHSAAHVLGESAECHYGCQLSHGPPVETGFFYDMAIPDGATVNESDWKPLEAHANRCFKEKQAFERLHVSIPDLKKMFGYSKYKMHYIENLLPPEGSTVYRCGTLVDLCTGPHIQNTNKIKTFQIKKNSSCYFLGDPSNDTLQRIYGVAFPDKKAAAEWKRLEEEAAKRDHRRIGTDQELFFFDKVSPGCAFIMPHGTIIFNALQKMIREQYLKRGYQEVQTPNMFDVDLWKTSGHWQNYSDDMFRLDVEKQTWALKPMNCPGHCMMFRHRDRSYRELPMRIADFGVLHRNEASGALSGMTRVRKFQQDDAHIFCQPDQVTQEIQAIFDLMVHVYHLFGMKFKLMLSTRPEKFLGRIEEWDEAESRLKEALDAFKDSGGGQWELNEGDGAFYGPKIDVVITDALRREWQCATIQLDFQLPQNFNLEYSLPSASEKTEKPAEAERTDKPTAAAADGVKQEGVISVKKEVSQGYGRPVMIHRAIIGSFERFFAILIEHFAGKWPFWLSPRQVMVIPVTTKVYPYVEEVQAELRRAKILADINISGETMPKKILRAQQAQYNFIFVVGASEEEGRTVNIRNRDDLATQKKGEEIPLAEAVTKLKALRKERRIENKL